jgi:acyl carrier protein
MKDLILNFLSQKFNKQVTEDAELIDLCQDSISTVETLFE